MSSSRTSQYPKRLRKFVRTIEKHATASGRSAKKAQLFGGWAACYVRFCTVKEQDWRQTDNVPPFLRHMKEKQQIRPRSLRRAAEGLLFMFEEMMGRNLGPITWRPDASASRDDASSPDSSAGSSVGASDMSNGDTPPSDTPPSDEPEQSSMLTRLLFHTSLPIQEALDLRVGDVDFNAGMIYVSDAMGTPKRIVEIPETLIEPLQRHVREVRRGYAGQPLDAPVFQANALKGKTADPSDVSASSSESPSAPESAASPSDEDESRPDDTAADDTAADDRPSDGTSRESLWQYAES